MGKNGVHLILEEKDNAQQLCHGGQLEKQMTKYGIAREDWLDLSTGISPFSYPTSNIPSDHWHRLPEMSLSFKETVRSYYGTSQFIACSGSQAAIQVIPELWKRFYTLKSQSNSNSNSERSSFPLVWLPKIGYKEHQKSWQKYGFPIALYSELPDEGLLGNNSVLVVINPNNPTGHVYDSDTLLKRAEYLQQNSGLFIVDEAFIETSQTSSVTAHAERFDNVIILRSLGKYFGLAGARLGFVFASAQWLKALDTKLGEWPITGPTLYIAEKALSDKQWQKEQTRRLCEQSEKLHFLLHLVFKIRPTGNMLFQTIVLPNAPEVFETLCRQGIYLRLTDDSSALRFGIPDDTGYDRLAHVLSKMVFDFAASVNSDS